MIIFNLAESDTKDFMNKLLRETLFDDLEIRSLEIDTFTKFEISGNLDKEYLGIDSTRKYCTWEEIRPYAFQMIKGKIKPKSIKIVFSVCDSKMAEIHNNASALHLNLNFSANKVQFTTATSQKNFSLEKTLDQAWDEYVINYFKSKNIAVVME